LACPLLSVPHVLPFGSRSPPYINLHLPIPVVCPAISADPVPVQHPRHGPTTTTIPTPPAAAPLCPCASPPSPHTPAPTRPARPDQHPRPPHLPSFYALSPRQRPPHKPCPPKR